MEGDKLFNLIFKRQFCFVLAISLGFSGFSQIKFVNDSPTYGSIDTTRKIDLKSINSSLIKVVDRDVLFQRRTGGSWQGNVQGQWRELGPITKPNGPGPARMRGTGRLFFIEFDEENHRIFTGSPLGGLWFSENEGETWSNGGTDYLTEIGVSHFQFAPNINEGQSWFIATGDGEGAFFPCTGVYRTVDKGKNWQRISNGLDIGTEANPPFWSRCRKILVHPTDGNILFAAFRHGVYRSNNALAIDPEEVTWERVADKTVMAEFFDVCFVPGSNGKEVIVSGTDLARSRDFGNSGSFQLLPISPGLQKGKSQLISIRISPSNPQILFAAFEGRILTYNLSDAASHLSWVGAKYSRAQGIAVSPSDYNNCIIGNTFGLFLSKDGAKSFHKRPIKNGDIHDDFHWLSFRSDSEIWAATDGGLHRSLDTGQTWDDLTHNIGVAVYYNIGTSGRLPDMIIGGGWDTGPNYYDAKVDTFGTFNCFGDAFESLIDDTNPLEPIYYVSIQGGMLRFDNNFKKFAVSRRPWRNVKGDRNWVHKFVKDPLNQSTIYYAGNLGIGRSSDKIMTWVNITQGMEELKGEKRFFNGVWHSPNQSGFVYAFLSSKDAEDDKGFKLLKTINANDTSVSSIMWEDISPHLRGFKFGFSQDYVLTDLTVDDKDPNRIWLSLSSLKEDLPKVLEFDGESWKELSTEGLEGVQVFSVQHQTCSNDLLYIGTKSGVFFKDKDHERWTKLFGLPHAKVTDMELNECAGLLRVSTFGRGIWETDIVKAFNDILIEKDTAWNETRNINVPVIIEKGQHLTINAKVNFGINGMIYLEEGARLTVDGAELTNNCQRSWKGIWIEGQLNPVDVQEHNSVIIFKSNGQISGQIEKR